MSAMLPLHARKPSVRAPTQEQCSHLSSPWEQQWERANPVPARSFPLFPLFPVLLWVADERSVVAHCALHRRRREAGAGGGFRAENAVRDLPRVRTAEGLQGASGKAGAPGPGLARPMRQVAPACHSPGWSTGCAAWQASTRASRAVPVVSRGAHAGRPVVAVAPHPHPPVGTPGDESLRGNSPPSLALVAGPAHWFKYIVKRHLSVQFRGKVQR